MQRIKGKLKVAIEKIISFKTIKNMAARVPVEIEIKLKT
jgi:hypothetical protein